VITTSQAALPREDGLNSLFALLHFEHGFGKVNLAVLVYFDISVRKAEL
jgi:hypothetical protein